MHAWQRALDGCKNGNLHVSPLALSGGPFFGPLALLFGFCALVILVIIVILASAASHIHCAHCAVTKRGYHSMDNLLILVLIFVLVLVLVRGR